MADEELEPADESTEEALSLPSFGFRRKRKKGSDKADDAAGTAGHDPGDTAATAEQPTVEATPDEQPTRQEPAVEAAAPAREAAPAEPQPEPDTEPVAAEPAAEPAAATRSAPAEPAPEEPAREKEPVTAGGGGHERWASLTSAYDEADVRRSGPATGSGGATETTAAGDARAGGRLPRWSLSLPEVGLEGVSGRLAALVVGALAGLLMVGGTSGTMLGCDLVRGTSACGGGAGLLLLLALGTVVVVAATAALRIAGVDYPGVISFLAVSLVVVVVAFLLLDVIFSVWMLAVIPLLSAASFVLAHALSEQFGDEAGRDWR